MGKIHIGDEKVEALEEALASDSPNAMDGHGTDFHWVYSAPFVLAAVAGVTGYRLMSRMVRRNQGSSFIGYRNNPTDAENHDQA